MIYEDIRGVLKALTGEDELAVFDQAVTVLEDYNATDYLTAFEMAMGQWGDSGADERMDSLRTVINTCLDYICQIQGVVLADDLLLSDKLVVARALLDIVHYEDADTILSYLAVESSDVERFAELMSLVSPWNTDVAMSKVASVSESFAANLKEFIDGRAEGLIEDAQLVQAQIQAYMRLKQSLDNKPMFADAFFTQLASIGLPLQEYMTVFKSQVQDLDLRPMAQTAEDLVSLATISGDGSANPIIALRPYYMQLYTDSKKQMDIDQSVKQLLSGVGGVNE